MISASLISLPAALIFVDRELFRSWLLSWSLSASICDFSFADTSSNEDFSPFSSLGRSMHRKRTNERERRKIPDKKRCDGTTEGRRRSELVSQALPRFPAAESVACWSLQRKTRLHTTVLFSVLVKPQRHLIYPTRFKRQVLFLFLNWKYSEKIFP